MNNKTDINSIFEAYTVSRSLINEGHQPDAHFFETLDNVRMKVDTDDLDAIVDAMKAELGRNLTEAEIEHCEEYWTASEEDNESREKNIMRGREAAAEIGPDPDEVDPEDAEDYGTAFEDLPLEDLFDTALAAVDEGHGLIESLMLAGADGSNIDELFELFKDYIAEQQKEFGSAEEDNENYASEGAVNLLDQLLEAPKELEDKINQVLEKVFVAVDILQQERYTDDPQLVKAYASLIEDHIRP